MQVRRIAEHRSRPIVVMLRPMCWCLAVGGSFDGAHPSVTDGYMGDGVKVEDVPLYALLVFLCVRHWYSRSLVVLNNSRLKQIVPGQNSILKWNRR